MYLTVFLGLPAVVRADPPAGCFKYHSESCSQAHLSCNASPGINYILYGETIGNLCERFINVVKVFAAIDQEYEYYRTAYEEEEKRADLYEEKYRYMKIKYRRLKTTLLRRGRQAYP